jgi:pimeloyl-ACP methyl ester carboxylesterase
MGDELRAGGVDAADRRVAWRALGTGPPIILLNGFSATAADWDPGFTVGLAEAFTVICPDHRGMGDSTLGDPAVPMTIDQMVDDVERVLDALEIDRAPIAGWSMGGFVAQRLAIRAPERVVALALMGTDPGGALAVRCDREYWQALTDLSGTPRQQASRLIPLLFPPALAPEVDKLFGDLIAEARAELDHEAVAGQERAMQHWHATDQPRPPIVPRTLVLHGTEDALIPFANAEMLASVWTGAAIERFDGCGHAFMAQDSAGASHAISTFFLAH